MMAKMNKTEAEAVARKMARTNASVAALTVEQITALGYQARRQAAARIYLLDNLDFDVKDIYRAHVQESFVHEALNVWGNKERDLRIARDSFKRACSGLTVDQANAQVMALLSSMNIRGADLLNNSLEVRRADREGARLYWRFDRKDDAFVNPDDAGHRINHYVLRLEISTGGTSYSLSRMALVHKIQGELLDAAHELDATFSALQVISVWGGKVEEPAADAASVADTAPTSLTNEQVEKISADMRAALDKVREA